MSYKTVGIDEKDVDPYMSCSVRGDVTEAHSLLELFPEAEIVLVGRLEDVNQRNWDERYRQIKSSTTEMSSVPQIRSTIQSSRRKPLTVDGL